MVPKKVIRFGGSQVLEFNGVQEGLREMGDSALSGKQNLEARVNNPALFGTWINSRDIRFFGSINNDRRCRFKEESASHLLSDITSAKENPDGSVPITNKLYSESKGTEFIIIGPEELTGASAGYAIITTKYDRIQSALNTARSSDQKFSVDGLLRVGGFKINAELTIDEHIKLANGRNVLELKKKDIEKLPLGDFEYIHGGWLEHFTGTNNATPEQYLEGAKLYIKYLQKAAKQGCFTLGTGMNFRVKTDIKSYNARPWVVYGSLGWSGADDGSHFCSNSRFLKACSNKPRL